MGCICCWLPVRFTAHIAGCARVANQSSCLDWQHVLWSPSRSSCQATLRPGCMSFRELAPANTCSSWALSQPWPSSVLLADMGARIGQAFTQISPLTAHSGCLQGPGFLASSPRPEQLCICASHLCVAAGQVPAPEEGLVPSPPAPRPAMAGARHSGSSPAACGQLDRQSSAGELPCCWPGMLWVSGISCDTTCQRLPLPLGDKQQCS